MRRIIPILLLTVFVPVFVAQSAQAAVGGFFSPSGPSTEIFRPNPLGSNFVVGTGASLDCNSSDIDGRCKGKYEDARTPVASHRYFDTGFMSGRNARDTIVKVYVLNTGAKESVTITLKDPGVCATSNWPTDQSSGPSLLEMAVPSMSRNLSGAEPDNFDRFQFSQAAGISAKQGNNLVYRSNRTHERLENAYNAMTVEYQVKASPSGRVIQSVDGAIKTRCSDYSMTINDLDSQGLGAPVAFGPNSYHILYINADTFLPRFSPASLNICTDPDNSFCDVDVYNGFGVDINLPAAQGFVVPHNSNPAVPHTGNGSSTDEIVSADDYIQLTNFLKGSENAETTISIPFGVANDGQQTEISLIDTDAAVWNGNDFVLRDSPIVEVVPISCSGDGITTTAPVNFPNKQGDGLPNSWDTDDELGSDAERVKTYWTNALSRGMYVLRIKNVRANNNIAVKLPETQRLFNAGVKCNWNADITSVSTPANAPTVSFTHSLFNARISSQPGSVRTATSPSNPAGTPENGIAYTVQRAVSATDLTDKNDTDNTGCWVSDCGATWTSRITNANRLLLSGETYNVGSPVYTKSNFGTSGFLCERIFGAFREDTVYWKPDDPAKYILGVVKQNPNPNSREIGDVVCVSLAPPPLCQLQMMPSQPEPGDTFKLQISGLPANANFTLTLSANFPALQIIPASFNGDAAGLLARDFNSPTGGHFTARATVGATNYDCPPIEISTIPYFKVFNGDVAAGSRIDQTCAANKGIRARNNGSPAPAFRTSGTGSATNVAAFASGAISGFASKNGQGSTAPGMLLKTLSFANSANNIYGGNSGDCIPMTNFFNIADSFCPQQPQGDKTLNASNVLECENVVGDVYISGNRTYRPATLGGAVNKVFATGNIYVGPNVTTLAGLYVAGGSFITCGQASYSINDNITGNCGSKLLLNGAVVAGEDIKLLRVWGTLKNADHAKDTLFNALNPAASMAETFNFTPDVWADTTLGGTTSGSQGTPGKYDRITTLPPVL